MGKYILLLIICPVVLLGQTNSTKAFQKAQAIFEEDRDKPQILLLGVFHFAGERVDSNTTPSTIRLDMLSPERQREITSLVKRLANFRPTKIAIEADPQWEGYYDSMYTLYRNGLRTGNMHPADETIQVGFRLAKMLGHEKLYPVNAQAFRFQLSPADSAITFEKFKQQGDSSYEYWDDKYDAEKRMIDTFAFHHSLNEYLQYLNSDYKESRAIGRWMVTTKRGSAKEPIGADGFITRYFNRNVRIYSNIQRIVTSKQDRILVIYGATHMKMLNLLFSSSPEFKLLDISPYLQ